MATKLFIPGPTEVAPEVLAAMSGPMMGHRSKAASALQRRISNNLRRILLTEQEILLSTSSGHGPDGRRRALLHRQARRHFLRGRLWRQVV